jgi:hypothetical protein
LLVISLAELLCGYFGLQILYVAITQYLVKKFLITQNMQMINS